MMVLSYHLLAAPGSSCVLLCSIINLFVKYSPTMLYSFYFSVFLMPFCDTRYEGETLIYFLFGNLRHGPRLNYGRVYRKECTAIRY